MAMKSSTTLSHITTVPNSSNSKIISEFSQYLKDTETSQNYQNQNLKANHLPLTTLSFSS
jgi:hypothetical protein